MLDMIEGKMLEIEKRIVIEPESVVWNRKVKEWCGLPYYDKKNGCPNFNKRKGCPMDNKNIDEILDVNKKTYIVGVVFNLKEYRDEMKKKHSNWTYRQLNNVIYWQGSIFGKMKREVNKFSLMNPGLKIVYKPEAYGVNLTKMLLNSGVPINWKYPLRKIYIVALLGGKI